MEEDETKWLRDEEPQKQQSSYFPEIPKRKNFWLKVVLSLVLLLGISLGLLLYTKIFDPSWNPFRLKPQEAMLKMIEKMKEIKTFHLKGDFGLSVKNKSEFGFIGNVWLDTDNTEENNLKSALGLDLSFNMEGIEISLAGESKTIGETSYLKITTIPAFPLYEQMFSMVGIDLSKLKDQWIKLDKDSFENLIGEEFTLDMEEELKKAEKERKEVVAKIKQLLVNKDLYFIKEELRSEKINGIPVYHYAVILNPDELKKIIPELMGSDYFEARLNAKNSMVQLNLDSLRLEAEMFYDDSDYSYKGFSCDYSLAQYFCKSIADEIGKEPVIFSDVEKYCAFTPLPVENYYHCVDSSGISITTNVFPGKTGYCDGKTFVCPAKSTSITSEELKKIGEAEFRKELNGFFMKVGELSFQIWIGKKDNLPYKFTFEKSVDINKFNSKENGEITVKINAEFSEYGKPIKIEIPENAMGLDEIFKEEIDKMEKQESFYRDYQRKSDMNRLQSIMENHFVSNHSKYFQSKSMPTEIEEITIYKEIGQGPCSSYKWISNLENSQKYCAWACLESGKFYIVSQSGTRFEANYQPAAFNQCEKSSSPAASELMPSESISEGKGGFFSQEASIGKIIQRLFKK